MKVRRRIFLRDLSSLPIGGALVLSGCESGSQGGVTGRKTTEGPNEETGAIMAKNILTVYFSHSGNTRKIAEYIHAAAGGDLVEIVTTDAYPTDYNTVVEQAKRELEAEYRPPLKTKIEDIGKYDTVFVGSPNWWGTVAPPVRTLLEGLALDRKTIVPFITHEGSR
ncbi:MAG: flavodoxin, partial [Planctomycetia bacterium]|nr:flavodoxin [Planctomycetia bacterium]